MGAAEEAKASLGLKGRDGAAAYLEGRGGVEESLRTASPETRPFRPTSFEQLVGLIVVSGRSMRSLTSLTLRITPWRIVGKGSETRSDLGGVRVDVEGGSDHDVAEVEGAGEAGGDHRQGQRGAFVGAGQVDLAVGSSWGLGRRLGRRRLVPIWDAAGQAGWFSSARSGSLRGGDRGDRLIGAEGDAGDLGHQARGQDRGDLAQFLFLVSSRRAGRGRASRRRRPG